MQAEKTKVFKVRLNYITCMLEKEMFRWIKKTIKKLFQNHLMLRCTDWSSKSAK